ncbi:MAG TPA: DUF2690 domain-containing protein [Pyrinomonadaceae bacterium]|jgi:hypothetical protein
MKRRLLLALAAGLFGALAATPAAAATCYGSGCNGLSPVTTGCTSGSYVVSETDIYDGFSNDYIGGVQLWWSPTCQAAWSYVYSDFNAFLVRATVTSTSPSNSYTQNNNYAYTARSPMAYATSVSYASACGRIEDVGVSGIACSP